MCISHVETLVHITIPLALILSGFSPVPSSPPSSGPWQSKKKKQKPCDLLFGEFDCAGTQPQFSTGVAQAGLQKQL